MFSLKDFVYCLIFPSISINHTSANDLVAQVLLGGRGRGLRLGIREANEVLVVGVHIGELVVDQHRDLVLRKGLNYFCLVG